VKAIHAQRESGQERLSKNLGDAGAEYPLAARRAKNAQGFGGLEGWNLGNGQPGKGVRPGIAAGGTVQSLVGKRQNKPGLPSVAHQAFKDLLPLEDAPEESKRAGRSR
jgi:hypothetical protein